MNPPTGRRGQVVLVNGPAGVGKTTISRRLAAAVPDGTCIHGDALRDFIVTRGPGRPAGLTYLAAAALTGVHLAAGFDRIVIDYIVEQPGHVDRFRDALPPGAPQPVLVTLWAPLAVVRAREAARPGRDRLGARVDACWSAVEANLDHLGTLVDATHPVDRVLADIEHALTDPSTQRDACAGPRGGRAEDSC